MGLNDEKILTEVAKLIKFNQYKNADSLFTANFNIHSDSIYTDIQALLYLNKKAYREAIKAYKIYQKQFPSPLSDLRMAQLYLLEYNNYKFELNSLLDSMINMPHLYKDHAQRIMEELKSL